MMENDNRIAAVFVDSRIAMEWPEFLAICKRMGITLTGDETEVELYFHVGKIPTFTVRSITRDNG